jgi:hypothetical protein
LLAVALLGLASFVFSARFAAVPDSPPPASELGLPSVTDHLGASTPAPSPTATFDRLLHRGAAKRWTLVLVGWVFVAPFALAMRARRRPPLTVGAYCELLPPGAAAPRGPPFARVATR